MNANFVQFIYFQGQQIVQLKQKYFLKDILPCFAPSMPKPKFEDNLQAIDKGANDFHNFLSQFKSRNQRTYFSPRDQQQNISTQHIVQKNQSPERNGSPSCNQEDLYENKSEFKQRYSAMENSGQMSQCQRGFQIRKPYKLNSSPPAKYSQQDNIKNQHPRQLIILKSAHELPHWLFDHIKKKNAAKLKNICIDQDKQRFSQIVASSEFDDGDNSGRTRNKMAQRYLNQSYVARKQKAQVNPQISQIERNYARNVQRKTNSQIDHFRKASSSSEMSNYQRSGQMEVRVKPQKNQLVYINDYEYSYCPDPQAEDRKKSFKSANHKSAIFEQMTAKKMHSARKSKTNQYRIRHQQKPHKISPAIKTPAKRLPTVSEQQPLVEPKKFALC